MSKLQSLEVTAGNREILVCTSDTSALTADASIIDANLQNISILPSSLSADGLVLTVTLPVDITKRSLTMCSILQLEWDFGEGHIENTRVQLEGKLC